MVISAVAKAAPAVAKAAAPAVARAARSVAGVVTPQAQRSTAKALAARTSNTAMQNSLARERFGAQLRSVFSEAAARGSGITPRAQSAGARATSAGNGGPAMQSVLERERFSAELKSIFSEAAAQTLLDMGAQNFDARSRTPEPSIREDR